MPPRYVVVLYDFFTVEFQIRSPFPTRVFRDMWFLISRARSSAFKEYGIEPERSIIFNDDDNNNKNEETRRTLTLRKWSPSVLIY